MAAGKVKQFWTAIVSFFCGLLASFRPAAPVAHRRPGAGAETAARTARTAAVALPPQRTAAAPGIGAGRGRRAPRARALPPTIKQRIHAEAHGTSPAVRRLTTVGALAADHRADGGGTDAEAEAAVPAGATAAR
ncbi:DUF6344 domain-containing protein [Streptomyces sp. TRM76323]|uniref:DUF6344 domain-containing protein n=1 Tax=Streptomyces tamarix TaxID=3078565 RepID=A0ABU3QGP5_9ACTN|nr:DUF6344 domain-containing protein [Streptomyces tamarix]MDT9681930.1 DUF6344 domain-containing protein [Streptomyces tamarix]